MVEPKNPKEPKRKSQLDAIRAKAKFAGVDVDAILSEITDSVANRLMPLFEQMGIKMESKVATKLAEISDALEKVTINPGNGAAVDIKAVIDGTAKVLEPIITKLITDQSQKAANAAFQTNSKALLEAVRTEVESRAPSVGEGNPENPNANKGNQGAASMSLLKELVTLVLSNAEGLGELVKIFRPAPPPESQIANQLGTIFKWHGLLTKIEKGGVSADELSKDIAAQFPTK